VNPDASTGTLFPVPANTVESVGKNNLTPRQHEGPTGPRNIYERKGRKKFFFRFGKGAIIRCRGENRPCSSWRGGGVTEGRASILTGEEGPISNRKILAKNAPSSKTPLKIEWRRNDYENGEPGGGRDLPLFRGGGGTLSRPGRKSRYFQAEAHAQSSFSNSGIGESCFQPPGKNSASSRSMRNHPVGRGGFQFNLCLRGGKTPLREKKKPDPRSERPPFPTNERPVLLIKKFFEEDSLDPVGERRNRVKGAPRAEKKAIAQFGAVKKFGKSSIQMGRKGDFSNFEEGLRPSWEREGSLSNFS